MKKKILSMFLAAAMTVSITTSIYAAGETETTEHIQLTDKIFNTTVVSENDECISTYGLNNETTYTVNLELTDGTEEIEDFTITDTEGQSISSQISNTNDSVLISGLVLDELYIFNSTVDGTAIRGAVETLMDGDTVVAVTDVYDFSELEAAARSANQRGLGSITWVPEEDDFSVYQLETGSIIKGAAHSSFDSDEFQFTPLYSGYADFKLLVPDNISGTITLSVYNSANSCIGSDTNSGTSDKYFRIFVTRGQQYTVFVNTVDCTIGQNYYLQVENRAAKAWFYQGVGKINSTYYWNTNKLDMLKYNDSSLGSDTVFTNNVAGDSFDGMSKGCTMAACAMIFANMGVQTALQRYDFRMSEATNYEDQHYYNNLNPDPYVVFLENNGLSGKTRVQDGYYRFLNLSEDISPSYYTMAANTWSSLAPDFGTLYGRYPVTSGQYLNYNSDNGPDLLKAALNGIGANITQYYGVILRFSTHSIVVVGSNDSYVVYDPGRKDTTYNGGISLFDYLDPAKNKSNYTYENVLCIHYYYLPGDLNS